VELHAPRRSEVDTEMGKWAEVDDDDGVEHEMELRGHGGHTHDE
jgi:hypothetical protein